MATIKFKFSALLLFLVVHLGTFAQQDNFRFKAQLEKAPFTSIAFAVKNTPGLLEKLLKEPTISVKTVTPEWIYIQASPDWINRSQTSGLIQQFYFEFSVPVALNDTTRANHFVDQVHNGEGGLQTPFTGKNVIIGYVDQGLDYTHPDFIDENGQTRVLYYWDHSAPNDPLRTPQPYGYGQLWRASDIQAGSCTSTEESTAHGTTVAGAGSGDGSANGTNKGMAPDSKIIIVETDFNLPNWTLTIADACDLIFKKADSLGMPAVVNLSLGSYLGSHDGNDPASILMEQLLDEQPGRIIVSAAGNSGTWGKYHVHGQVDADTSFVWLRNNPSGQLGNNTVYLDVWADGADATWKYALSANLNSGSYQKRAQTVFRPAVTGAGTVIYDTLYNGTSRIATIELYPEIVNGNFHIEVYFSHVDSTSYNIGFQTTGSGVYDAWSGLPLGLNSIVSVVPPVGVLPAIAHYHFPDTLQTIVSSWNCSEKVVTVGNVRNRLGHVDANGGYYTQPPGSAAVHQLSLNSSKGPTRHNVIKPDITASGDVALSPGPLWLINNPIYNSLIDSGGFHVRNGGTSMASPVVAGIAALYLEKCHKGTYQSFKSALSSSAFTDAYTGTVPNNAYGYGKVHALNLLLLSNYTVSVDGPSQYCGSVDTAVAVTGVFIDSIIWNTQSTEHLTTIDSLAPYYFTTYGLYGCVAYSDTLTMVEGDIPATPVITVSGTTLSTPSFPNLQWYSNGVAIPGATGNTITIPLPNSNDYTVAATGTTGCVISSEVYNASAGLSDYGSIAFSVYPNPVSGMLSIGTDVEIDSKSLYDIHGKRLKTVTNNDPYMDVSDLSTGTYFLLITSGEAHGWMKIIKN